MNGRKNYRNRHSQYSRQRGCCGQNQGVVWWLNMCLFVLGSVCLLFSVYLWLTPTLWWSGRMLALRFSIFSSFAVVISLLGIQGTCRPKVEPCDISVYLLLIACLTAIQT